MLKLAVGCLACVLSTPVAAAEVGALGDTSRMSIRGADSFSREALRRALSLDLEFQAAARPSASVEDLLRATEERLTLGYRRAGFPGVKVSARHDAGTAQIIIEIEEGVRYDVGDIRISAPSQELAEEIKARIIGERTEPSLRTFIRLPDRASYRRRRAGEAADIPPAADASTFRPGEPMRFATDPVAKIERHVRDALADFGHLFADVAVSLELDDAAGKADVVVQVDNESLPALVDEIRLAGLERNRREDVLTYLDLKEGMRLDRHLIRKLNRKLRHSGRFWTHSVTVQIHPSHDPPRTILGIDVSEYPHVPPIGQPLSPVQEAALRIGLWLDSLDGLSEDLEFEFTGSAGEIRNAKVHVALSPTNGFAFRVHADAWQQLSISHAGVVMGAKAVLYSVERRRRFTGSFERLAAASATVRVLPGRLDADQPLRLEIGLGLDIEKPAFVHAEVHPVVFIHLAEQHATSVDVRDDRITLAGPVGTVEADVVDGTITEVRLLCIGGDDVSLTLRDRKHAVAKLARELDELGAAFPNEYDREAPLPSALSFLLKEYSHQLARAGDEEQAQHIEALTQYVDEAFAGWWRERFADKTKPHAETVGRTAKFIIQPIPVTLKNLNWLPHLGPYLADELFERGSSPWTLLREFCFLWAEIRDTREMGEVRRLIDAEKMGPVACLFAAALLARESADSAAAVARLGLSRMDETYLRQDLHALFMGNGMRSAVDSAGRLVRSISQDARQAILARLPRGLARFLGAWSGELDRAPHATPVDVLVESFVDKWNDKRGAPVNDLLERYVNANEEAVKR